MEKKVIKYRYVNLELAQFATFEENFDLNSAEVLVNTEAKFDYQENRNIVLSEISVTYIQSEKPVLKAMMRSAFALAPDSLESVFENNAITLDIPLLIQFASLNYGAMRGALSERTLGTHFHDFILPPVYFDSLIKAPYKIDIKGE